MKRKTVLIPVLALCVCFLVAPFASASPLTIPAGLEAMQQGGILPNAPDYDWWYGCSPTSAGMMMGFYDLNGYQGRSYDNLVQGGSAELSSFGNPGALANNAIASQGHIDAFYKGGMVGGYLNSGDDTPRNPADFNSLADFMGTSQDAIGNVNGSTTFWNYTNGARLYAWETVGYGIQDYSGMFGLLEYARYCGYNMGNIMDQMIYNQYIDALGLTYGFSWADYMSEIDAGRVVMIHVEGHSMFGYGYDALTHEIILHDTWSPGEHRMTWGGSYAGLGQYAVTVFEPTGGTVVPEPSTVVLLGIGLLGLGYFRKKRM